MTTEDGLEFLGKNEGMTGQDVENLLEELGLDKAGPSLVGGVVIRRNQKDPTLLAVDAWTTAGVSKESAAAILRDIARTWEAEIAAAQLLKPRKN